MRQTVPGHVGVVLLAVGFGGLAVMCLEVIKDSRLWFAFVVVSLFIAFGGAVGAMCAVLINRTSVDIDGISKDDAAEVAAAEVILDAPKTPAEGGDTGTDNRRVHQSSEGRGADIRPGPTTH